MWHYLATFTFLLSIDPWVLLDKTENSRCYFFSLTIIFLDLDVRCKDHYASLFTSQQYPLCLIYTAKISFAVKKAVGMALQYW